MKAFPHDIHQIQPYEAGMELRDYFAAKAMQGLVSTVSDEDWNPDETAQLAYFVADAMMKAR